MTDTKADYVLSSELNDAMIPLDTLATVFNVTDRTIRNWCNEDGITRHPYPGGKAVRWGDIPTVSSEATRWVRH